MFQNSFEYERTHGTMTVKIKGVQCDCVIAMSQNVRDKLGEILEIPKV